MKKLKMLAIAAALAICTCFLAFVSFADETDLKELDTPSWIKWGNDNVRGLYVEFETIPEADGEYFVRILKDGVQIRKSNAGKTSGAEEGTFSVWHLMEGSGTYTFQVMARGDEATGTLDSDWSEPTEPFVYKEPALSLGEVRNLHWSDTETGVLAWDPPASVMEHPEYSDDLYYYVRMYYKDGDRKLYPYGRYNLRANFWDVTTWLNNAEDMDQYVVTVQAQSRNIEKIAHGPEVESDEFIDTEAISDRVGSDLNDILMNFDSENEEGQLASPSDALVAMEELDIKETAIAMQVSESALDTVKNLEQSYLDRAGKAVEMDIAEDTGLKGSDIEVIGAGLNIASASDAVTFEVKKSERDVELDPTLYTKSTQFEIRLNNAEGTLRAPVTIIMPVPEGIRADSMRILHYHGDGEAEVIWPAITSDGKVRFTVTKFSVFAFVERAEAPNPGGNEEPGEEDNTHHSSSGGGGGSSNGVSSSTGTVTTDAKKGRVNSLTGIIIGSGDGYSKWIAEAPQAEGGAARWKLQYADGTFAAGSYVTDEQGNPVKDAAGNLVEQPLWEMISGAWYAFGADGYAKSGLIFDPGQNGWFCIDINTGMKIGWQQIDGKWYYFNPTSDGSKGIMYVNRTTPDGYTVGADGVWNGQ